MSVSIEDIGAVANLLAAIGVLLTLIYLARQVRQGNLFARAQARQRMAALSSERVNGVSDIDANENGKRGAATKPRPLRTDDQPERRERRRVVWRSLEQEGLERPCQGERGNEASADARRGQPGARLGVLSTARG